MGYILLVEDEDLAQGYITATKNQEVHNRYSTQRIDIERVDNEPINRAMPVIVPISWEPIVDTWIQRRERKRNGITSIIGCNTWPMELQVFLSISTSIGSALPRASNDLSSSLILILIGKLSRSIGGGEREGLGTRTLD